MPPSMLLDVLFDHVLRPLTLADEPLLPLQTLFSLLLLRYQGKLNVVANFPTPSVCALVLLQDYFRTSQCALLADDAPRSLLGDVIVRIHLQTIRDVM